MTHRDAPADLPALGRPSRRLSGFIAAAALALVAGHAQARDLVPVAEPQVVEIDADSDCLYWDLCVGYHKPDAIRRVADTIVGSLTDPEAMYVVSLPQLPTGWQAPPAGSLTGMFGDTIDRRRLSYARGTYQNRVESALVKVIEQVLEERPGARVTLQDFHAVPRRGSRVLSYERLEDAVPFVALSDMAPAGSANAVETWLAGENVSDDAAVLVETQDGWVLAAEGWQSRPLIEPLSEDLASAWPAPEPEPGEAPGGGGGIGGGGAPGGTGTAQSVSDLGLAVVASLGEGRTNAAPSDSGQDSGFPEPDPGDDGGAGQPDDPGTQPVGQALIAGAGFAGPTPQPATLGAPGMPGYTAKVIARWDVVPFQTIDGPFDIGVVAFHINGIDRVEFSLNDGPWTVVDEPSRNERTAVWEYTTTVDARTLRDGLYEIRARVFPNGAGIPRVLAGPLTDESIGNGEHSMLLSANANGTLPSPTRYVSGFGSDASGDGSRANPFRSVSAALADVQLDAGRSTAGGADGAMIYCLPGEYTWGPKPSTVPLTENRWATVMPAPGVRKDEVVFVETLSGGFKTRLIHARDITAHHPVEFRSAGREKFLWLDGVDAIGDGRITDVQFAHGNKWTGMYVTDTLIAHTKHGAQHAALIRGTTVRDISNDAFSMGRLVVNCIADGLDPRGTDAHPDVYQLKGDGQTHENFIVYGLRAFHARSQGIFADGADRFDNIAFVNVLLERDRSLDLGGGKTCQWKDISTNHLLMRGVTLAGYTFTFRTNRVENLSVVGCVFTRFKLGETGNDIPVRLADIGGDAAFRDNHYIDVESFNTRHPGSGVTTGDPRFRSPENRDYRPRQSSLLAREEVHLDGVESDANGRPRGSMTARGALEPVGN